jgi:hypothetical protein
MEDMGRFLDLDIDRMRPMIPHILSDVNRCYVRDVAWRSSGDPDGGLSHGW